MISCVGTGEMNWERCYVHPCRDCIWSWLPHL